MRYLILSDIHGNWEALEAVLKDAEGRYDDLCCLGDIVGYGADPNAVTDWVRQHIQHVIRGNHDKACCGLEEPVMFNPVARRAAEWTLEVLTAENRDYLHRLAQGPKQVDGFEIVHGSVLDEDEYLIDPSDAQFQFPATSSQLVFFGHTHVQGGFLLWEADCAVMPRTVVVGGDSMRLLRGRRQLINPGSVGQPRDGVWQAGYVLFDSDQEIVEFRRCPYDLQAAQRKIRDAGLPDALAGRLALGR
jgi:predicted phosphodiesterase